jgi:calcineurin-like phosphoesterase family protein
VIWYTSDTHFGHENIVEYCQRPFLNVQHMNEGLVERWNRRVGPDDVVYHLGDFSMYLQREEQRALLAKLHGHKVLVLGNHDGSIARMLDVGFVDVKKEYRLADGPYLLYLRHKPKEDFEASEFDFHLCGHVHEKWARKGKIVNVGVDVREYEPQTINELLR